MPEGETAAGARKPLARGVVNMTRPGLLNIRYITTRGTTSNWQIDVVSWSIRT